VKRLVHFRLIGCALGAGLSAGVCWRLACAGSASLIDALTFACLLCYGLTRVRELLRTIAREYL